VQSFGITAGVLSRRQRTLFSHIPSRLSDTYGDSINSEIRSSVFLTNNFHGFSFNVAGLSDRSYWSSAQNSVYLRSDRGALRLRRAGSLAKAANLFLLRFLCGAVHREISSSIRRILSRALNLRPKSLFPSLRDLFGLTASAAFRHHLLRRFAQHPFLLTGRFHHPQHRRIRAGVSPRTLERFFDRPLTHHRYKTHD